MSAQWSPSSAAPPPDRRGSGAFRDTLIVAAIAVVGVAGLVIWDGGDSPVAAIPEGQVPGGATIPGGSPIDPSGAADAASAAGEGPSVGGVAADAPTPAADAAVAATAAPAGADYEVDIGMQDSLIGLLPVPAGATEMPPDGAGIRSWTIPGLEWQAARDAYLEALTGAGYTYVMTEAIDDGTSVGELYTLTHSSGTPLQLGVGTFESQTIVEVSRQ